MCMCIVCMGTCTGSLYTLFLFSALYLIYMYIDNNIPRTLDAVISVITFFFFKAVDIYLHVPVCSLVYRLHVAKHT